LKGRASQIKHLAPALLYAVEQVMDPSSQVQRQMRLGLMATIEMDQILDEAAEVFRLPRARAERFIDATYEYLAYITALRRHFEGVMIFHVTIKAHYLIHIAFISLYMSPRLGWNYSGEDFVGRLKFAISACTRGTPPRLVVSRAISRYVQGFGYDLMDDDVWA
jgi:hypothetical protein